MAEISKIIIQAGGKGTRLEGLTLNKPKCLVPVNNLPIIFYAFKQFKNADFTIIADYKIDVLKQYLDIFASDYSYKIIKANEQGTISGIKEAIEDYREDEPFMVLWCDLILSSDFKIPGKKANYIGISKDFECRWSYKNDRFIQEPSSADGVAGLFIFENKKQLKNIKTSGAFVEWLDKQNISFKRLDLFATKEIGTLLSYSDNNDSKRRCRPFNSLEVKKDIIIKKPINDYGKKIANDEINWYKYVKALKYGHIPEIYNYNPLEMKLIQGKNIYEYDCLTKIQKQDIIKNIVEALEELHNLEKPRPACIRDIEDNYINKTFERLSKVKKLIPFTDREFIKINGKNYRNIFFVREEFTNLVRENYPSQFHLIHGDCTFSNIMFDTFNMKTVLIDPRGYFGKTKLYGDIDYDWAKLYYSINGKYDKFNQKKFNLCVKDDEIELNIQENNWSDMSEYFFKCIPDINKNKIKLLQAIIWLSLTTYACEDYDSILGAFYNGLIKLDEVL